MLKQAKELLSLKAFKPCRMDIKVPLKKRVGREKIMGISVYDDMLTLGKIEFGHTIEVPIVTTVSFKDFSEKEALIRSFSRKHKLKSAVLMTSPGLEVIRIKKAFPNQWERLYVVKHGMKDILGEFYNVQKSYACVSDLRCEESLVFSYNTQKIEAEIEAIESSGLEVLRVTCGIQAVLDHISLSEDSLLSMGGHVLLISGGAIFLVSVEENRFKHFEFKEGISLADLNSTIAAMLAGLDLNKNKLFYLNASSWDIEAFLNTHSLTMNSSSFFEECKKGAFKIACHG